MKKGLKITLIVLGTIAGILLAAAGVFSIWWNRILSNADLKESWSRTDGTVLENLRYGPAGSNTLDLFIPASADKDSPQALMLFIHGGSWMGGSKADETFAARRYAKEGYFTATMNYSLVNKDPGTNMLTMLDEIQQAITFIKEYTDGKGYYIDRMALSGISAGGHLAMLYGLRCASHSPIPVKFIAQRVGPAFLPYIFNFEEDVIRSAVADSDGEGKRVLDEVDKLMGWTSGKVLPRTQYTKENIDSLMTIVSPASYVGESSVPLLMAYGGKDNLVHRRHGDLMDSLYTARGIRHDILIFPNSSHPLGDDPDCAKVLTVKIKEYCKEYFGY
jgi:acetyl esterase/lipase